MRTSSGKGAAPNANAAFAVGNYGEGLLGTAKQIGQIGMVILGMAQQTFGLAGPLSTGIKIGNGVNETVETGGKSTGSLAEGFAELAALGMMGRMEARLLAEASAPVEPARSTADVSSPASVPVKAETASGELVCKEAADAPSSTIHPSKAASASSDVSEESVIRALRQSRTVEGAATAKAIRRGVADLELAPTDPYGEGAAGRQVVGTNRAIVALDKAPTPGRAAGVAAHEVKHVLQKLTPETYRQSHEVEAYQWQKSVDKTFPHRTEQEIKDFISSNPKLYSKVPAAGATEETASVCQ